MTRFSPCDSLSASTAQEKWLCCGKVFLRILSVLRGVDCLHPVNSFFVVISTFTSRTIQTQTPQNFLTFFFSADLKQHVNSPTHRLGHTLGLLITREMDTLISHTRILPDLLSDHQVIVCYINLPRPPATRITVTRRKTRDKDLYAFQKDICRVFFKESVEDLDGMITRCDIMHLLLDKYNQEQIRNVTVRPHAPRFSDDLRELKRVKRRRERKFQSSRLSIDK